MSIKSNNRKNIDLNLSFKPEQEQIISKVQKEITKEELDRFDSVKENDINISTSYVFDNGDNIEISVFFRNGLSNKINFEDIKLDLVDSNQKVIASKTFNLREVGDIPPKSARPWKLYFDKEDVNSVPETLQNCKVIFNKSVQALQTVDVEFENINDKINIDVKRNLEEYLKQLPLLEKNNITLHNYSTKIKDNSIIITVIVRNGMENEIKVEQIPVTLYDANNKIVFSQLLNIDNLKVSPLKAQIYNLIFEFDPEKYLDYDLTQLKVDFKEE